MNITEIRLHNHILLVRELDVPTLPPQDPENYYYDNLLVRNAIDCTRKCLQLRRLRMSTITWIPRDQEDVLHFILMNPGLVHVDLKGSIYPDLLETLIQSCPRIARLGWNPSISEKSYDIHLAQVFKQSVVSHLTSLWINAKTLKSLCYMLPFRLWWPQYLLEKSKPSLQDPDGLCDCGPEFPELLQLHIDSTLEISVECHVLIFCSAVITDAPTATITHLEEEAAPVIGGGDDSGEGGGAGTPLRSAGTCDCDRPWSKLDSLDITMADEYYKYGPLFQDNQTAQMLSSCRKKLERFVLPQAEFGNQAVRALARHYETLRVVSVRDLSVWMMQEMRRAPGVFEVNLVLARVEHDSEKLLEDETNRWVLEQISRLKKIKTLRLSLQDNKSATLLQVPEDEYRQDYSNAAHIRRSVAGPELLKVWPELSECRFQS
ncbi:hypothetical protein BGZ83_007972 [Gryganskiella cystojenkinii]|nr:hypothetical protein BGZ83_007972 [Gryganskiella cystojenkinii]